MVRFESVELTKRLYGDQEEKEKEEEEEEVEEGTELSVSDLKNNRDNNQGTVSDVDMYGVSDINALNGVLVDSADPYRGKKYSSYSRHVTVFVTKVTQGKLKFLRRSMVSV